MRKLFCRFYLFISLMHQRCKGLVGVKKECLVELKRVLVDWGERCWWLPDGHTLPFIISQRTNKIIRCLRLFKIHIKPMSVPRHKSLLSLPVVKIKNVFRDVNLRPNRRPQKVVWPVWMQQGNASHPSTFRVKLKSRHGLSQYPAASFTDYVIQQRTIAAHTAYNTY